MAEYPGATLPYPSLTDLRESFRDQTESEKFREATTAFCNQNRIQVQELVGVMIGILVRCDPPGVGDLAEVMRNIIKAYDLRVPPDDSDLYKAVKGVPSYSGGRLGYTFGRRETGTQRGVFLFRR